MYADRRSAGFTLIEVVLAIGLMVLVWTVFYSVATTTVARIRAGEERLDAEQNVRLAMDRITRELRQAKTVETLGEKSISWRDVNQRLIRYYLDDEGEIQRAVSGGGNNIVAYGIDELSVSWGPDKKSVCIAVYALKHQIVSTTTVNIRMENH